MGRKLKVRRDPYGAWLQHLRTERRLSQAQLAQMCEVAQTTLAYWERTGNLPGRKLIIKMADALKVSVEELLRVDEWERELAALGRSTGDVSPKTRKPAEDG